MFRLFATPTPDPVVIVFLGRNDMDRSAENVGYGRAQGFVWPKPERAGVGWWMVRRFEVAVGHSGGSTQPTPSSPASSICARVAGMSLILS